MEGVYHEDEHFNYFLAEAVRSIAVSFVPTYVYFFNPNGIMVSSTLGEKRSQSLLAICEDVLERGQSLYKYIFCLNFVRMAIDLTTADSSLRPRVEDFLRQLCLSSRRRGCLVYSFYVWLYCRLPYERMRRLIWGRPFTYAYCLIWRMVAWKARKQIDV